MVLLAKPHHHDQFSDIVKCGITILIPRNTDNSVLRNVKALPREVQANRSFRFWVVSNRTVSRGNLATIRGSVLVPMEKDHKHDIS